MDWMSRASAAGPFITDSLTPIPDLVSPETRWIPLEQGTNAFVLDTAATDNGSLPKLQTAFLALDEQKETLPGPDPSLESSSEEEWTSIKDPEEDDQDVWTAKDVVSGLRVKQLLSWDRFLSPLAPKLSPMYLSESPLAFNAALDEEVSRRAIKRPDQVAHHDAVLRCLLETALGRESALYRYDGERRRFVAVTEFGMRGMSPSAQDSIVEDILDLATSMRHMDSQTAKSYSNPILIALSAALSTVLQAIKTKIETEKVGIASVLQLEHAISRPRSLLKDLEGLFKAAKSGDGTSKMIKRIDDLCSSHIQSAPLLIAILGRAMAPVFAEVSSRAGLTRTRKPLTTKPQSALCEELVSECERCLEITGSASFYVSAEESLGLTLRSTWEDIGNAHREAQAYEARNSKMSDRIDVQPMPTDDFPATSPHTLIDIDARNLLGCHLTEANDGSLADLTLQALSAEPADPLWSRPSIAQLLDLSLTPLLTAQARLLSFRTLRLLIKDHSLRTHISLLNRFMLMTDGVFTTRLSQALFDSELVTADGRRIEEGRSGLRLQTRETWPPASSELRLVLMGILSETYGTAELPGGLSFAIRDLSEEELEACRDLNNVGALDFLRMQYKPEAALGHIITEGSLEKYDRIFRFMLRLLRVRALVQYLVRDVTGRNRSADSSQRIRWSMLHFVTSLTAYVYEATTSFTRPFEQMLADVKRDIDHDDYEATMARAESLSWIEHQLEDTLDSICTALFLDDRISQTIDRVFTLILRFSTARTDSVHASINQEFLSLTKSIIRDISQKHPQHPFDRLLIKLDMWS